MTEQVKTLQESIERFRTLTETLQLHRRDLFSRLNRKLREKIFKPARDLMPARRERMQRNRRHRLNNVIQGPPELRLSSRFRYR